MRTSLHPAPVLGDPHLIERLAANLLDDAVRHNTAGGTIHLATGQRDGRAVISVANRTATATAGPPGRLAIH
jgi:signal transduction histidine kinase